MDEIFLWNWKVYDSATSFFWFCYNDTGTFGYRMEHDPESFEEWGEQEARNRLHEFVKHTLRQETFGPYPSEIPPLIKKIRLMEKRWTDFQQKKSQQAAPERTTNAMA